MLTDWLLGGLSAVFPLFALTFDPSEKVHSGVKQPCEGGLQAKTLVGWTDSKIIKEN